MKLCPECRTPMKETAFDGRLTNPANDAPVRVHMDHCQACGGHWFDRYEAEATMGLTQEVEALAAHFGTGQGSGRHCPVCKIAMQQMRVLGITLDNCPGCLGLWFDGGELKALNKAVKARGVPLGGEAPYAICASCGAGPMDPGDAYYGDNGMVCGRCIVGVDWAGTHQAAALEQRQAEMRARQSVSRNRLGQQGIVDMANLVDLFTH